MMFKRGAILLFIWLLIGTANAQEPNPSFPLQVVDAYPFAGMELKQADPFSLTFNQPVNPASIARALSFDPPLEGRFIWRDGFNVDFFPLDGWPQGVIYQVTLGMEAQSLSDEGLEAPYYFNLMTVQPIAIGEVNPAPDAQNVEVDNLIIVPFNRPIVPLVSSSQQDDLPQPIEIDPPLEGEGEWVNTALYVFRPSGALRGDVTYTVRALAGLTSIDGATLAEDYIWQFSTIRPQVLSVSASSLYVDFTLDRPIRVTFNQEMDKTSTEAAFRLTTYLRQRDKLDGTFTWDEDGRGFTFQPSERLLIDTNYTVVIEPGALSFWGDTGLTEPFVYHFYSLPPFSFSMYFSEGAENVDSKRAGIMFTARHSTNTNSLEGRIEIQPEPATWEFSLSRDFPDREFYLYFDLIPETDYTITIKAGVEDIYGHILEQDQQFHFRTRPLPPIEPNAIGIVHGVTSSRGISLFDESRVERSIFASVRGEAEASFNLYSFEPEQFKHILYETLPDETRRISYDNASLVREWVKSFNVDSESYRARPIDLALEEGGQLPPGLYALTYLTRTPTRELEETPRHLRFAVINSNLTVKFNAHEMLVWATDLHSNVALPHLPVRIYNTRLGLIAEAVTDADGIARLSLEALADVTYEYGYRARDVWVVAEDENSFGYWGHEWSSIPIVYPESVFYLYTDRSIYRAGEMVYFRGMVRTKDDMTYHLPETQKITVRAEYSRYRPYGESSEEAPILYEAELDITPHGSFSAAFRIPEDNPLGHIEIRVFLDERHLHPEVSSELYYEPYLYRSSIGVEIADYRVPEYFISLDAPNEAIAGDELEILAQVEYYAGGKVNHAPLEWLSYGNPIYFPYQGRGNYRFQAYDAQLFNPRWSHNGLTDAQGQYLVEDTLLNDGRIPEGTPLLVEVQAVTHDQSQQRIAARRNVLLHPAEIYVGLRSTGYVQTLNEPIEVPAITITPQGQALPHQTITFTAVEMRWAREPVMGEYGVYVLEREEIEQDQQSLITDENGEVIYRFTPPNASEYQIRARVEDAAGRPNSSSLTYWVRGEGQRGYWGEQRNHDLVMQADQESYAPGDTAQILIPIPFSDQAAVSAWVTVERATILSSEIVELSPESDHFVYEVPITSEHIPTIFVSVVLLQASSADNPLPNYRQGGIRLEISPAERLLYLDIIPSQTQYNPRETGNVTVIVRDAAGQPVSDAEVGLHLTDKAVLDLRRSLYAAYGQVCMTPPRLAPLEDPLFPVANMFYGRQSWSVNTELSMSSLPDVTRWVNYDVGGGCGGGGSGNPSPEAPFVRTDFITTPLWEGHLITDAAGRAEVSFTLPDNLTTWQFTAIVITPDTRIGQAHAEIVSSLPLRVRPVTPRFFVAGDRVYVGVIIQNETDAAQEITATLETEGAQLETDAVQTATIPAYERVFLTWPILIEDVSGVDLIFSVTGENGLADSARPSLTMNEDNKIPVYRYTMRDTVGTAGFLNSAGTRIEGVSLPPRFDAEASSLELEMMPSLAAPITDALTFLKTYPHNSIEQQISRFLPNAVSYQALESLGLLTPEQESAWRAELETQLDPILRGQAFNNGAWRGWGWSQPLENNALINAYGLLSLSQAEKISLDLYIDEARLEDTMNHLMEQITTLSPRSNLYPFLLFAVASTDASKANELLDLAFEERAHFSIEGQAFLLLAYAEANPDAPQVRTLLSDAMSQVILSGTGAHWDESERRYWGSRTRTSALMLLVLTHLQPENELIPQVIRWLMIAREGRHWSSTQENVWVILALTEWMLYTDELNAAYAYDLSLNTESILAESVTADSVRENHRLSIPITDLAEDDLNYLSISRQEGRGALYYSVHLDMALPIEDSSALSRGLTIQRDYFLDTDFETPIERAQVGDVLLVRLTLTAPQDSYFVVIEEPLAAGFEIINLRLNTSEIRRDNPMWNWGTWRFNRVENRDVQINLYADFLPRGTYVYTYWVQVTSAGDFLIRPTQAYSFYQPEIFGRNEGRRFEISPE